MSSPPPPNTYFGRDARFYKGTVVVAHTRNITLKASAQLIKVRSNDSLQPIKSKVGEQTFSWSIEHLFVGKDMLDAFQLGSVFDIVFAPDGSSTGTDTETWKNCVITGIERKTDDGIIENISGEATNVEFPTAQ
jgi:hypothetical protein